MSATANQQATDDVERELTEEEVMSLVRDSETRFIETVEQRTAEGEIETRVIREMVTTDNPAARISAYNQVQDATVQTKIRNTFEDVFKDGLTDAGLWFNILFIGATA